MDAYAQCNIDTSQLCQQYLYRLLINVLLHKTNKEPKTAKNTSVKYTTFRLTLFNLFIRKVSKCTRKINYFLSMHSMTLPLRHQL